MKSKLGATTTRVGLAFAIAVFDVGDAAHAELGAGWLLVRDAPLDGTFDLRIGTAYSVAIISVSNTEVGFPTPETIPVWVNTPHFGNTMHTATQLGDSREYEFTYTPPAIAVGDARDACGWALVSYGNNGQYDAREFCPGPQWACEQHASPGYLRFVDAAGVPLACPLTAVENATWSSIKLLCK